MFGENGCVIALEGHIGTNEHPISASESRDAWTYRENSGFR